LGSEITHEFTAKKDPVVEVHLMSQVPQVFLYKALCPYTL